MIDILTYNLADIRVSSQCQNSFSNNPKIGRVYKRKHQYRPFRMLECTRGTPMIDILIYSLSNVRLYLQCQNSFSNNPKIGQIYKRKHQYRSFRMLECTRGLPMIDNLTYSLADIRLHSQCQNSFSNNPKMGPSHKIKD